MSYVSARTDERQTVCVQVERSFLFIPYWADLGCQANAGHVFLLTVNSGRWGYDFGTHRYRTRAQGSFMESDGRTFSTPNIVSDAFPFTF